MHSKSKEIKMKIATHQVMKHDVFFNVADFGESDINNFCVDKFSNGNWEAHSFYIFDKYDKDMVKCSKFLTAMNNQRVSLKEISFIKIDIEGAEAEVIGDMERYISVYKPTIYLSIHHHLLSVEAVDKMLTFLSSVYNHPLIFNGNGESMLSSKEDIINNQLGDCVYTKD